MTIASSRGRATRRRGAFAVIELTLTAFLLAVAMTLTVQALGWVAGERRATERRETALREAANLMERFTARPRDEITPEAARKETLSEPLRRLLPDGALTMTVDDKGATAGAKRIALKIRWRNRAGDWDAPIRLSAWVHPRGRSEP